MNDKSVIINGIEYNTYACLHEATEYNNAIINSKWQNLDEQDQARLLVMATRKIDSYNYAGKKVVDDQPLKFPRVMCNGKTSDNEVLTNLCCQVAAYYNDNGSAGSEAGDFLSNVENYQIGDLHVKFKSNSQLELSGIDDLIKQALGDWSKNQGMEIWL